MGKLRLDRYRMRLWGLAKDRPDPSSVSPEAEYICTDTGEFYVERDGQWFKVFYDDPSYASAVGASTNRKAKTAALADDSNALEGWTKAQIMLMASEVFGE